MIFNYISYCFSIVLSIFLFYLNFLSENIFYLNSFKTYSNSKILLFYLYFGVYLNFYFRDFTISFIFQKYTQVSISKILSPVLYLPRVLCSIFPPKHIFLLPMPQFLKIPPILIQVEGLLPPF